MGRILAQFELLLGPSAGFDFDRTEPIQRSHRARTRRATGSRCRRGRRRLVGVQCPARREPRAAEPEHPHRRGRRGDQRAYLSAPCRRSARRERTQSPACRPRAKVWEEGPARRRSGTYGWAVGPAGEPTPACPTASRTEFGREAQAGAGKGQRDRGGWGAGA